MKVYKTQLSPDTSALSALKTISFFAFAIFLNSHRSIDFIETRLLNQTDRVGDLKKEIIGKCEELLPRCEIFDISPLVPTKLEKNVLVLLS